MNIAQLSDAWKPFKEEWQKENHQTQIQTDLLVKRITPEDCVAVPVVCHANGVTFALGRHQSPDETPVYVSHHHISAVCENELWQSTWKASVRPQ